MEHSMMLNNITTYLKWIGVLPPVPRTLSSSKSSIQTPKPSGGEDPLIAVDSSELTPEIETKFYF